MEPNKQGGEGPSDLDASNDPAQRRDGPSSRQPPPSSLVEQTMPPPNPPQLLQHLPLAALQPQPFAFQHLVPPRLPLPPLLPQGLALGAAGGVPWQPQGPQQLDGANLYLSMPQFYGHTPGVGATIPFFGSTFLSADQVGPRSWSWAPATGRQLTLQERRALQDVSHLVRGDVDFVDSSACVVRLLQKGWEDVRALVFNGVMGALQFVMSSRKWHVVFVELLRARRPYELQCIVHAAYEGKVSLIHVACSKHGLACVANLFRAVNLRPELRQDIINCLAKEGLFQHNKFLGDLELSKVRDLLHSFFTTFPGEDCRVVIRHVLDTWDGAILSKTQALFLTECCVAARDAELQDFEKIILSRAIELAEGTYSNIFLEKILQRCRNELREEIAARVLENLVNLSMHRLGIFVVMACFVPRGQGPRLLQRVLTEFLALHDEQLAQLVADLNAYSLFRKLLGVGKHASPGETKALALRIQNLEVAGEIACVTKELVTKVLAES